VLPIAPQRVLLFISIGRTVALWDYPFEKVGTPPLQAWHGRWQEKAKFAVPFAEPFHVAASEGAYFFVTDSGGVYMAEETGGKWQAAAVWKDTGRPVLAMLVESDGATAFVFGKDFYFKVAKKPEPKPCRDVTKGQPAPGQPELTERARLVYECGRVLFEKGELRGGPTQK
jgi:hypothetical protein